VKCFEIELGGQAAMHNDSLYPCLDLTAASGGRPAAFAATQAAGAFPATRRAGPTVGATPLPPAQRDHPQPPILS